MAFSIPSRECYRTRTADQKFLYAGSGNRRTLTARVYRVEVPTGRREVWKEFSLPDPTGISSIGCNAITPDGKAFVFTYSQRISDLYVVDGLR